MKLITAIIQNESFESVKSELFNVDVHKMTVSRVKGCGQQAGYDEHYRGQIHKVCLLDKIQIKIAVNEEYVDPTIKAIVKGAKTGKIGDGKIFVTELDRCIRIRTEEDGEEAVG